jgi:hypothetical protein
MALAKQAILTDSFTVEQNIAENGLLRAYLIIAGRITDLTNTDDAIFIEVDKFGTMPMGSSGGVTTLQQAYINSIIPQITTTDALGALTIKNGSTTGNTNNVFVIQNTGGTITSKITSDGIGTFEGLTLAKESTGGIKIDTTTPAYGWNDLIGKIQARTGGATVPTFASYIGNIYQWSFGTVGGVTEVFNELHIRHDYVLNTDMYIHAHWSTALAPTGNVNWMFDATYSKGYNQDVFNSPVVIPVLQTSVSAYRHMIAESQLSAANGLIASAVNVSITSGNNILTSASALFNSYDIGRTIRIVGAGAGGADLDTTITAYASTTGVTVADNASTTITNSPNFRYRVLNSSLLEVDGILIIRGWRDSNRTADTLNVAPFLHTIDVHYQSININTKNKNYPFYT